MQTDPIPTNKLPMEQITDQGVSGDYYNALLCPLMQYRDFREGIEGASAQIRERPIQRYADRYPPSEYNGVLTNFNRHVVTRLDEIADELNRSAQGGTLTDDQYRALHTEACKLLFGRDREESYGDGRTKRGKASPSAGASAEPSS